MAYKRHSQGGRFKAANFGDLGLRALKDQQERQIRSLKDEQREEAQMGSEHLREMRGAAARELEHNRQLQNFYNKRDNLAIENTQFRGKTEYDRLMGEAKEYEKKAKFWSNFSSTYADQYIKAAEGIYDIATTEQSNRQQDAIFKDPKFIKFEASYSKLNNIASRAHLDEAVNILRDKNSTPEQKSQYLGHIVELGFRMNHKTKLALLQRELNNWHNEARELRSLAARPGKYPEGHEKAGQHKPALVWNEDTVGQFYYLRARELMRAYGVDPSSQAGREFLKGVEEEAVKERKKLGDSSQANSDEEYRNTLSESTKNLVGKNNYAVSDDGTIVVSGPSAIVYNNEYNTRVVYYGAGWRKDDNGAVIKPTENNLYNNKVAIMKSDIMSGRFKSKEQARRHTILQLKPKPEGDVKYEDDGRTMQYDEKDTWLGQHGERLQKEFDEAWDAYEKQEKTKADEKKVIEDWTTVEDLKRRGLGSVNGTIKPTLPDGSKNPEYIDLSDDATIFSLMKENAHRGADSKTMKFLGNYKVYNAYDLNGDTVTFDLTAKYKAGKLKELREHISFLPEPIQKQWESKIKQLEILERKDLLGAKLTAKGSSILQGILGTDAAKPLALNTEHFQATIKYIEQDFLATLEEEYEKDPTATDAAIIAAVRTEINRKINVKNADGTMGEGVYRRSNTGSNALSTKFLIDPAAADEKAEASLKQVEAKFLVKSGLGNQTAFSNGMKDLATDGKFQVGTDANNRVYLVSLDDADDAVIAINEGRPVPFNESIEHIYKYQPKSKDGKEYSRRDIWNAYFKGVGIDTTIPQNSVDFASDNYEKSEIMTADTSNLSEPDKAVVGAVCKMVDEGIYNTQEKSAERQRIEKKEEVQYNFIQKFLIENYGPDRDRGDRNLFMPGI